MTTFSASFSSPTLPELIFLSPHNSTKRLKLSLYRAVSLGPRSNARILGSRIRAVQREESAVLEERDRELAAKLNGSVNGNYSDSNGSYGNGSVKVERENGSLDKYVNGNGNVGVGRGDVVLDAVEMEEMIGEKKSVEEIGQEEAWFKRGGGDQVEVDFVVFVLCYALNYSEF